MLKSHLIPIAMVAVTLSGTAYAQPNCPAMRKINIGVSVAPPNVVHTSPYVAKALGYFEKRCIDANIVQFEGGQSQTSAVAARPLRPTTKPFRNPRLSLGQ